MSKSFFTGFILCCFLLSCGQLKTTKMDIPKDSIEDELRESDQVVNQHAFELLPQSEKEKLAEQKLSQMIEQAKSFGPQALEYLSSDLYIKGIDASLRGDAASASFFLKFVYSLNPTDAYLGKKYAIELIKVANYEEAKNVLENIYANQKQKEEKLGLVLAGTYAAVNDFPKAIATYEELTKKYPKSEDPCLFLSQTHFQQKNTEEAYQVLSACKKRMPKMASFYYYQGKMYEDEGAKKSAVAEYKKAVEVDPAFDPAVSALGDYYEANGETEKVLRMYKKFLKKSPYNPTILSKVIDLLFEKEDYKGVIEYGEKLVNLDPTNLNLKVKLGILYSEVGRVEDAKSVFKEILEVVPNSDKVLYYLASLYQQAQENQDALYYYSRIPEDSVLFLDGNLQIAQILHAKSDSMERKDEEAFLEFAYEKFDKAKELQVELGVMLATYFETRNEVEQATNWLEKIRPHERFTEAHDFYLASLYEKVKEFKKAQDIVGEILEKDPHNADALNFMGYSLLENGNDLKVAYEYINKALALKPNDGYILDSLGWYYYKTGDLKKALSKIREAQNLVKTDSVITKHLAIIYQEMQQFELAKKYLQEAIEYCKHESEKEELLNALKELESKRLPASVD